MDRTVKGSPGAKLVVRQLGGELDGIGMIASGVTRLAPGAEAVLFLGSRQEEGVRRILGLSQGQFPVYHRSPDRTKSREPEPGLGQRLRQSN